MTTGSYFLGGHDLEMCEIARVLQLHGCHLVDRHLSWSQARFAAYEPEIRDAIRRGARPVLVELSGIPDDVRPLVDVIDHHGPSSGSMPSSLDQVLQRLGVTPTREQQLISANDRGHIDAMLEIGATPDEVARLRRADRQAQGISEEEEREAEAAIALFDTSTPALTVVRLPHSRTATVVDRLHRAAGGPGFRSLLVECPREANFFGNGATIEILSRRFGGYSGGMLPARGFWGLENVDADDKKQIEMLVRESVSAAEVAGILRT